MKGYIEVSSRKGGVGTTTTACAIALALESMGNTVLILDTTGTDSVSAVLGINGIMGDPAWRGVTVKSVHIEGKDMPAYGDYDCVVVDAGHKQFDYLDETASVKRVCVVRNEYLTVKANMYMTADVVMAFIIPTNALTAGDVKNVLRHSNFIDTQVCERLSRSIDAGMFPSRWQDVCGEWPNAIVDSLMAGVA